MYISTRAYCQWFKYHTTPTFATAINHLHHFQNPSSPSRATPAERPQELHRAAAVVDMMRQGTQEPRWELAETTLTASRLDPKRGPTPTGMGENQTYIEDLMGKWWWYNGICIYIYKANIGDLMRCDGDRVGYLANNHELGLSENGAYNII